MLLVRLSLRLFALVAALALAAYLFACVTHAQSETARAYQPDLRRALAARTSAATDKSAPARVNGYRAQRDRATLAPRPARQPEDNAARRPARPVNTTQTQQPGASQVVAPALITDRIPAGTPLRRVLHTAQLSTTSSAGTDEQFYDATGDLRADARATFDTRGGAFDLAVGRTGTRYEVFSAIDDRGTVTTSDDLPIGVLVNAFDTNGDFTRDAANTYDLRRDFQLPSAAAVVAGTSRAGREFVCVSSSGYYNRSDPNDPANEPSAGVVLLVRDFAGGFDNALSRTLVSVGSNQLSEANALALMPNNDLLIADFDSDELRVVRDTNNDGLPDWLDPAPYYSYRFSNDAPLDIAVNSRGVVFSHSAGADTVLLALYDTNQDGRADTDVVVVEGLSIDNNLILHGLTVDREGTVYVIEDATGAADTIASGGNGGVPAVDAFPDPALNGFLRDGALYVTADNPTAQALTGLAFGTDAALGPVATLALANSASRRGDATRDGLGTITGAGLTLGRSGRTNADASARGVRVTIEGRAAPVHSFNDTQLHVYVPAEATGVQTVVVTVDGTVTAAEDVNVTSANPGLFTLSGTGGGEAIALLASGVRYTAGPFPARFDNQPSVVALFGTGWRNSAPVSVTIGGRAATVEYAGPAGGFPGLDQLNVRLPDGVTGAAAIVVRAANGATSRTDVVLTIR
ncbi:MAG TPA: IPT/TIG domain-containing protein [Pyrinomonadaceae bacterium]|jgi:uncharacterized protein (TIGR03437 family)